VKGEERREKGEGRRLKVSNETKNNE